MHNAPTAAALFLLCASAAAQCCLGAQNQQHTAAGGRFRVTATSQLGTGPGAHGPYRFRFVQERLLGTGDWETVGAFERAWSSKAHFHMTVLASPSGNGLLLKCSMEPDVLLLSPAGDELARLHEPAGSSGQALWPEEPDGVWLEASVRDERRRAALFVPLALIEREQRRGGDPRTPRWEPVDDSSRWWPQRDDRWIGLRRAVRWRPELGAATAAKGMAAVATLGSDDVAAWPQARMALRELGWSAKAPLEAALAAPGHAAAGRLRTVHAEILAAACGHEDPWRNLDLLVALAHGPSEDLAADALAQWRSVAPPDAPCRLQWLCENAARLRWEAAAGRYTLAAPADGADQAKAP